MTIPSSSDLWKLALIPGRLESWPEAAAIGYISLGEQLKNVRNMTYMNVGGLILGLAAAFLAKKNVNEARTNEEKKDAKIYHIVTWAFLAVEGLFLLKNIYHIYHQVIAIKAQYAYDSAMVDALSGAIDMVKASMAIKV